MLMIKSVHLVGLAHDVRFRECKVSIRFYLQLVSGNV